MRPARLADVAKQAGVSITTASVVLNDKAEGIPQATRRRVLDAAEALGYRTNRLARSLRTQRSMTIGLISAEIATLPFAGALIRGAQDAAWEAGFMLVVVDTDGDQARERRAIDELRQRQVDGFLYATMYHQVIEPPDELAGTPTVLLDARTEGRQWSSVVPDEAGGATTAVGHLLEHGHRRIGYLQNDADIPATDLRLHGYELALEAAGIEVDRSLIEVTPPEDRLASIAATRRLLERRDPPTAIFAFSDRAAAGVYAGARQLGLRVPDELSIVGFDNLELVAAWLDPGLTTVQLPHEAMGHWAVGELVSLLTDSGYATHDHLMPCPLVERGSVAHVSGEGRA